MRRQWTTGVCLTMLIAAVPVAGEGDPETWSAWPPRAYLVQCLADGIEPILKTQDPATGRFGTQPWICTDQNVLLALACAWALEDPRNPWYHDARLLQGIARGGEALVDDQDAQGMWIFRKKDNSTWGQIHMPWTYSRWIRAYELVKDALPPDSRAKWEAGLRLGFAGIRKYMDGGVHNIPCHHAMALYVAGKVFDEPEWQEAAAGMMARVVAKQDPAGYWSENFGPVVGYNHVYIEALGVYYSYSQDPVALEALRRGALFHAGVLWPDGSSVACIDERQIYHKGRDYGNVGFTWTPEGRGFLLQQWSAYATEGGKVGTDMAAQMLLYGGEGTGVAPASAGDRGQTVLGANGALIKRDKPWSWAFSAYTCPVPQNRWIQDRHNYVDVFQDDLGLVIGGGNTKLQPYWSTFTVGDPELLKHQPGDENPDFAPDIPLKWLADRAALDLQAGRLDLTYGEAQASVSATRERQDLVLTYRAPSDQVVEAHVPLLWRGGKVTLADGLSVRLTEEPLALTAAEIGQHFVYAGLKVTVPAGARLLWPCRQHDPYTKDGRSALSNAKLVLCLPFAGGVVEQQVRLSLAPEEPFRGLVFEARDLPFAFTGEGYTKRLDSLGAQLLAAAKPGESLTFTLPSVKPGRYELLAEFVLADVYGVVRVLLDGRRVGEPFDAYTPGVDAEGERVSFGPVDLTEGTHTLTLKVVTRNPKASKHFIGVKRWLLRPL
ncbi:MAG: hypothetical protein HPY69_07500 [Armatimonadetes bacterium]|nr:hypothetical protein [Armatimonadota bacterium]